MWLLKKLLMSPSENPVRRKIRHDTHIAQMIIELIRYR
jgi:hypothetical protein